MGKETTKINERTYTLMQPSVKKSIGLALRTVKIFLPILGSAAVEANELNYAKFFSALTSIDTPEIEALLDDCMKAALLTAGDAEDVRLYESISYERHFSEYPGDVFQALGWCLWTVTNRFLPEMVGNAQFSALLAKVQTLGTPTGAPAQS